jgi:uncharacterized protein (DUF3820 family)
MSEQNWRGVRIPFGKYKGSKLGEIPHSYIKWLKENTTQYGEFGKSLKAAYEDMELDNIDED